MLKDAPNIDLPGKEEVLDVPESNVSEDKDRLAFAVLYEHRLNRLGLAFAERGLSLVVVKGQGIVDLAMVENEVRPSSDVDLLVGEDLPEVVNHLLRLGYTENPQHSRHFKVNERSFRHTKLELPSYVEVHTALDKIIFRPIPYNKILARSQKSKRAGISYPSIEDLLLLFVLHASSDIYFDGIRVERDLKNLMEHGKPDMEIVRARAREWGLLRALERLLTGKYSKRVKSGPPTRCQIIRYFIEQLRWHDTVSIVLLGVSRYLYARLLDKILPEKTPPFPIATEKK